MLDHRAELFKITNRWLPNQVGFQQPFAMDIVNNLTEDNLPLGTGRLSPPAFANLANSSLNRLLSARSSSTDSFNDPDGPAMINGNGNCETPDFEHSLYEERPMGTPNSFIEEQPQSPDLFTEERQRLMSTSSSFTYSPYSPYDDGQNALVQPPPLDRQTSLAIVEEVLRSAEACGQPMFFPKDDSPVMEGNEDSCLPPYPSPSFVEHFNANNALADNFITSSQGEDFFAAFSGTDLPVGYQCDGSPPTESSPAANTNNNNCNDNGAQTASTNQETVVTCSEDVQSTQYLHPPTFAATTAVERQNTNLSDIISTSFPQGSLDAHEMMQDFYNALSPSETEVTTTVDTSVLAQTLEPCTSHVQSNCEQPGTSANSVPENSKLSEPCPNEMDVAAVRRERNNAACRQSRKRRKEKKQELEHQADFYAKENEQLKIKIEDLEIQCKRVKASILEHMTNNVNSQITR